MLMATLGRIAGISGIFGGAIGLRSEDRDWRLAFVLGLLLPGLALTLLSARPAIDFVASPVTLVIAGVLVGFGTRLGSGCTSGHGVCGLARLSPRSMVAVAAFMAAGVATAVTFRHIVGGGA
jgi:uncharacterized membrane protein YedE/YeeE